MSSHVLKVDIDPRNLRSFRQLDFALDDLTKKAIDGAASVTSPVRITLSLTVEDARVTA